MATKAGILDSLSVAGTGTLTDVYTVPASKKSDVNIRVTNSEDTITEVKIAHIPNGVASGVAAKDYILGGTTGFNTGALADNRAPIRFTGELMETGDTIAVSSSASAVAVQVLGIEEDA